MSENIQQEFLNQTISSLTNLQEDLRISETETLSEDLLRRLFRQIHSVKGTAQAFNFKNLAHFAHKIEDLLQALNSGNIPQNRETSALIERSLIQLLELCRDDKQTVSIALLAELNQAMPSENNTDSRNLLADKIPKSLLSKLSAPETESLKSALERDKIFYLIEVFFDFSTFNVDFIRFRQTLSEAGKILAISPSKKADSAKEIGFQLFYVTDLESPKINRIIESFRAGIDFSTYSAAKRSDDLAGLLSNLIRDGEKKARILDKKISFEVFDETKFIARKNLILINYLLLHLLRNGVDHAIELPEERVLANKSPEGKIKISISHDDDDDLILYVEDDGRGIDSEKVTAQAQKRGVITANQNLTKDETINLVFTHGFTTSEFASDISGRGVGLDAVKDLIEKAGGQIKVQTEINRGTIFQIKLPA